MRHITTLGSRLGLALTGSTSKAEAHRGRAANANAGDSALTAGHSLALRQLWRGEEVGRITWFFGPHL